jgi:glutaredoxin-related protein
MSHRPILDSTHLSQPVQSALETFHRDIVQEVQDTIAREPVVIVGMRWNDACTSARRLMTANHVPFTYLEYGGYFSEWRRRLALKMWTGWPTFPMIFVRGTLVGGASDAKKAFADGTIQALLNAP